MSILSSLYSGASGLTAQSQGIAVLGDNIANVNTVGFKTSRGSFYDILGQTVNNPAGGTSQVGLGVRFGGVEQVFTQGSFATTGKITDLAIDGGGFFVMNGQHNGVQGQFFTRSGQFHLDASGVLVNHLGMTVQGYPASPSGALSTSLSSLQIAGRTLPATRTGKITLSAALDSRAAVPGAWSAASAATTSNYSTSVPVYDSLGNNHDVKVYFRNTGVNNAWEWHAVVDGGEVAGGIKGTPFEFGTGTVEFTNTGALSQVTTAKNTVSFAGAAPNQSVDLDFGDAIAAGGTGRSGSSLAAQTFAMNKLEQDGYGAGSFSTLSISGDGTLSGVFTNGQHRTLGRLAVASFPAEEGLEREGGSLWAATRESGAPLIGQAGSSGRGQIMSGALEQSNVDLTEQFVQMIALQRGFQANSKTIQTSDENYMTLVQLKR